MRMAFVGSVDFPEVRFLAVDLFCYACNVVCHSQSIKFITARIMIDPKIQPERKDTNILISTSLANSGLFLYSNL